MYGRAHAVVWVPFAVLNNKTELERWNESGFALGLFSMSHMDYVLDRDSDTCTKPCDQPPLDLMVKKAINRLKKNENGFFLMVESGMIDQAHHKNWAKKACIKTMTKSVGVHGVQTVTGRRRKTPRPGGVY